MIVYLNGRYLDARQATIPVFDPGFLYGDGIFETMRTYNGRIFQLGEHLDRLLESAKTRGWELSWRRDELSKIITKTVARNGYPDSRIRVTITPGVEKPTLFVWVQPLDKLAGTAYSQGVSAITFPLERAFPRMKTTSMQPLLIARVEMEKRGAFEALLVNHKGNVTEGTWTNLFIVKDNEIITPKLGVLLGKTRDSVIECARHSATVSEKNIPLDSLLQADECFVTNSTKGIVPVVRVDGAKIANGKPGPVTKKLMKALREMMTNAD